MGSDLIEPTNQIAPSMGRGNLREVASFFLKLGFLAFGGAAGHVAMMRRELVDRRKWISEQDFFDLFGIMNLIPGPSSTETVIALGYWRAGWPALILAGVLLILPAMLMIIALSWAYVRYGTLPAAQWVCGNQSDRDCDHCGCAVEPGESGSQDGVACADGGRPRVFIGFP